ncbi:MAG: ribbon-helix-helix protein, CopG family [Bryobacterales bacterium]|nr:ribbon-helix-helix protein, CopG family [Bryobacterales bacterium]MDE0621283.1 ribbon-helix-helix protein, CopG family [Bryobacterales bacterium]
MTTTVHLPADLLESIDHQAKELRMSRNRYIIRALRSALDSETRWSPRFVGELEAARSDEEGREALAEMRAVLAKSRTRKDPPEL